jgi:hypothetical protein
MLLLVGLGWGLPVLGEGPQQLSLQVVGSDQPVVAEWVGQGRLTLENQANAWSGEIHTEPLRFLQLRLWEGDQSLWEGTVPLTDQRAEILSFRVVDQAPGRPRRVERVGAAGPLPTVGGMEGASVLTGLWALLLLAWLVGGLRLRRP